MLFSCASASQTDNRHLVVPHCRRYYWSRGSTLHFEIPKWLFTKSTLSLKKEYKNKITEKCQIHPETRPYNTLATQCLGTVYLIISVILTGLILNLLYQGCFILFCQNIALFYSQKHTNMTQTHWEHKSIWKKKKKKSEIQEYLGCTEPAVLAHEAHPAHILVPIFSLSAQLLCAFIDQAVIYSSIIKSRIQPTASCKHKGLWLGLYLSTSSTSLTGFFL